MAAWTKACDKGAFDMHVLTKARAEAEGFRLHERANFLGLLYPEPPLVPSELGFDSLVSLSQFLVLMEPVGFELFVAPGEDGEAMGALLKELAENTLH